MIQKRKIAAVGAPTTILLCLMAWPVFSQEPSGTQLEQPDVEGVTRFVYSGGILEGVRKVSQDAPQQTTSTVTFINVTGASASWFVPAGDSDLLNVGFSGECRLINSMLSSTNQDWVEIRALITRAPLLIGFPSFLEPYDTVSPMAFCSANGWAMHHANWARRVTGGTTGATYTVQIQYKVTNNAPAFNALGVLSPGWTIGSWKSWLSTSF